MPRMTFFKERKKESQNETPFDSGAQQNSTILANITASFIYIVL